MPDFKRFYRNLFAQFGHPLSTASGVSADKVSDAEKRLGAQIPASLRDYYLVAGRERHFNTSHNRLLPLSELHRDKQRLVFMEENQRVVVWSVSARGAEDPAVYQGIPDEDEPIDWNLEYRKCSVFLAVMLHYQAVNGALRFCANATAPDGAQFRWKANGWTLCGEVNSLKAYNRRNQVVCLMPPPSGFPIPIGPTVLAGGKTKADLRAIASELELPFG